MMPSAERGRQRTPENCDDEQKLQLKGQPREVIIVVMGRPSIFSLYRRSGRSSRAGNGSESRSVMNGAGGVRRIPPLVRYESPFTSSIEISPMRCWMSERNEYSPSFRMM